MNKNKINHIARMVCASEEEDYRYEWNELYVGDFSFYLYADYSFFDPNDIFEEESLEKAKKMCESLGYEMNCFANKLSSIIEAMESYNLKCTDFYREKGKFCIMIELKDEGIYKDAFDEYHRLLEEKEQDRQASIDEETAESNKKMDEFRKKHADNPGEYSEDDMNNDIEEEKSSLEDIIDGINSDDNIDADKEDCAYDAYNKIYEERIDKLKNDLKNKLKSIDGYFNFEFK